MSSCRFFRSVEFSPEVVFVTDQRKRIVFWNDSARRLLGFKDINERWPLGLDIAARQLQRGNHAVHLTPKGKKV